MKAFGDASCNGLHQSRRIDNRPDLVREFAQQKISLVRFAEEAAIDPPPQLFRATLHKEYSCQTFGDKLDLLRPPKHLAGIGQHHNDAVDHEDDEQHLQQPDRSEETTSE